MLGGTQGRDVETSISYIQSKKIVKTEHFGNILLLSLID